MCNENLVLSYRWDRFCIAKALKHFHSDVLEKNLRKLSPHTSVNRYLKYFSTNLNLCSLKGFRLPKTLILIYKDETKDTCFQRIQ